MALLQIVVIAEQDDADVVRLEVHDHAAQAALHLQQLARHRVGHAGNAANAVRHAADGAELVDLRVLRDLAERAAQGLDQLPVGAVEGRKLLAGAFQKPGCAAVIHGVA